MTALLPLQAHSAQRPRRAGKLKIFFGFAPGVGKTYAMLAAARARRAEGVDVVAGWVETHHRAETEALLEGLARLPPQTIDDGGILTQEFDREAALDRHPDLVLVDELAHSNAAGSLHRHRWEDVFDLLAAGVDVYTTVNVQHVESLTDVIAEVTGVTVHEVVPDSVIERADDMELIDIPPDDLLKRLHDGKICVNEQAQRAVTAFFRKGNLFALRELALRRAAERVGEETLRYRSEHGISGTWAVTERIAVCVGPGPGSAAVVRATRRMAGRMRAPWFAIFVETPAFARLSAAGKARAQEHLALAARLGATPVRLRAADVAKEVLRFAAVENVTQIVVGKPTHPRWKDFVYGSVLDDLLRDSGKIGVYAILGGGPEEAKTTE